MKLLIYVLLAFFSFWTPSQTMEKLYNDAEVVESWSGYEIDVWERRSGVFYPSGIYCPYPRPHFRRWGPCPPFFLSRWKIDFNDIREPSNPAEQYIDQLFETAFLGSAQSQYLLGYRYHKGKTFKEDPIKAFAWYSLADQNGHPSADFMRNQLTHEMTDEQLEEGRLETISIVEQIDQNIAERNQKLQDTSSNPQNFEFPNFNQH